MQSEWRRLVFYDPQIVLPRFREVEQELAGQPSRVRRLSGNSHRRHREGRDAAILAHGLAQMLGTKVFFSPSEAGDHDFLLKWRTPDAETYCPVQLKELVHPSKNPHASLSDLFAKVARKYAPSGDTALAIRIGKEGGFSLDGVDVPPLPFKQLWFFGSVSPDQRVWFLYGDVFDRPSLIYFNYPRP